MPPYQIQAPGICTLLFIITHYYYYYYYYNFCTTIITTKHGFLSKMAQFIVKYQVSMFSMDVTFIFSISWVSRSRRETYHSSQSLDSVDLYLHDRRSYDVVFVHEGNTFLECGSVAMAWPKCG